MYVYVSMLRIAHGPQSGDWAMMVLPRCESGVMRHMCSARVPSGAPLVATIVNEASVEPPAVNANSDGVSERPSPETVSASVTSTNGTADSAIIINNAFFNLTPDDFALGA